MKKFLFRIFDRKLVIIALSLIMVLQLDAQDRSTLESQRKKILEDIRETERMLNTTKKDVQSKLSNISAIQRKISLRESLIKNLNNDLVYIENNISKSKSEVLDLKNQLEKLRESYAESVYKSYKFEKANQQLMFVLGAESMNQAIRRMNYIRKINQTRKEQAKEIDIATLQLEQKIKDLEAMSEAKKGNIAENSVQLKTLAEEKGAVNTIVAQLKQNEKKYKDEIGAKQKEKAKLDKQIQVIIEREIAEAEAKNKTKTPEGFTNTPDPAAVQLSKDFVSNKGKLPWPVEKGYISRGYGPYTHAELKLQMDNTGIDIRTSENAAVRAVFNGEVVTVMSNPTFKNAVIIKHGEYFSVYTGLGKVSVTKGSKVTTKQVIGSAFTEDGEATEVHLEIWKGKTKTDPSGWILKR
jgi:septal ring factor EnvC (AmiA/AmiB activator)